MTVSVSPRLLLDDVTAGDELPALDYDVSATTVVLGALATRDYILRRHELDYASYARHRNKIRME